MKTCRKCGETKAPEMFNFSGYKDKLRSWCKECYSVYNAEYRIKNAIKLKEYFHQLSSTEEYKLKNRAKTKQWKADNRDKVNAGNARYRAKNKDSINERHKERNKKIFAENPNYYIDRNKSFDEKYPNYQKEYKKKYDSWHRQNISDQYIRFIFNKLIPKGGKLTDIPQELIEAKRLQILINRRIKNENSNNTTK